MAEIRAKDAAAENLALRADYRRPLLDRAPRHPHFVGELLLGQAQPFSAVADRAVDAHAIKGIPATDQKNLHSQKNYL